MFHFVTSNHRPSRRVIAGLGASLLMAAPSAALAATRQCDVNFSISSVTELGSLQFDVDYAGAGDVGDLTSCTIVPSGVSDSNISIATDSATLGWADATGFTGPAAFASCKFTMPDITDTDPTIADFVVENVDATDHQAPANPVSPTIAVAVANCGIVSACAEAPLMGCKVPAVSGKAKLSFKDNADNAKDQGQFQWKAGSSTDLADFQDPTATGKVISWCVYEDGALSASYDVPSGAAFGWAASGTTGFQFKGDVDGISQIKMKAGADGKASVQVKGKSKAGNFVSPALPLSTGSVVTQLVIDGATTTCFQSTAGTPKKNDAASYSAAGNP